MGLLRLAGRGRERQAFFKVAKERPSKLWICKPTGMNQGKGIYIVKDVQQFRAEQEAEDKRAAAGR